MDLDRTGGNWNLFVEWAIPGIGNIPVIQANFLNGKVSGGVAKGLALSTSLNPTPPPISRARHHGCQ
jgi:hypothetical protein